KAAIIIKVGKTTPTRGRGITPTKDGGKIITEEAKTTREIRCRTTITISRTGISRTLPTNSRTKTSLTEHLTIGSPKHLRTTNSRPLKSLIPFLF
ncbi:hypothetical protein, partial [Halomonas marinisediminis]|uniref:hypothetical protein n=1 Tax=Halomonas marinisediminis TaxID=2546095 RepID=UPI00197AAB36